MSGRLHPTTAWTAQLNGPDPEAARAEASGPVLEGFRIAVTSDRRSADLVDAFVRRGAEVIHAPAVRIAPVEEDEILVGDTRAVIESQPDVVIVTTAYGFRRWIECADAAGLGEDLGRALTAPHHRARPEGAWCGARCGSRRRRHRRRRAHRLHGHARPRGGRPRQTDCSPAARARGRRAARAASVAGAAVLTLAPYRWVRPTDESRLGILITAGAAREVDVVTFTQHRRSTDSSLPQRNSAWTGLLDTMRCGVTAAAVGPVTAAPLIDARHRADRARALPDGRTHPHRRGAPHTERHRARWTPRSAHSSCTAGW